MKTLMKPLPHRSLLIAGVAFLVAIGLIRPSPVNTGGAPLMALITTRDPALSTPSAKPAMTLPFSMRQVVVFLSDNFQIQPLESRANYARFRYLET